MRILAAHNFYQRPGGEDTVFDAETSLLEEYGHSVQRYTEHNDAVESMGSARVACNTIWSSQTHRKLRSLIREYRPDVAHFHNTLPLISPSAYYAAQAEGVAVVQTLHNYRLACPSGVLYREGRVCNDCVGAFAPWRGVLHRCYRQSFQATGVVSGMLGVHRALGTWRSKVDAYISMTEFSRHKFIEAGLPAEQIFVKPHFVRHDPGVGAGSGGYALFVGRLSVEKGVLTFLRTLEGLRDPGRVVIVGDGPLAPEVRRAAAAHSWLDWYGHMDRDGVDRVMGDASFLVVPSEWYETFGLVVIEAFAKGTPVVVADLGAVGELVSDRRTGIRFQAGDEPDLARAITWMRTHPREVETMRLLVRAEYENRYRAADNYDQLMAVYEAALRSRGVGRVRMPARSVAA